MIKFQFLTDKRVKNTKESNIVVLFILEGEIKFNLEEESYILKEEDFITINAERSYSYITSTNTDVLIGKLIIDRAELKKLLKNSNAIFWCNSTLGDGEKYDKIRSALKRICNYHYSNQNKSQLFLISIYYDFLSNLSTNFLLTEEDENYSNMIHKNEERKQKIEDYINENYDKEISLNDLSEKLYLSNAYLSKYIKKQFGISFLELVNKVRLEHAIEALVYSDKPVVRIAVDCGFSSSAAFNKVFKEKYNITPSLYRVSWKGDIKKEICTDKEDLDKKLMSYYEENMLDNTDYSQILQRRVKVCSSSSKKINNRCILINAGTAADLLHSDMQEQILSLKEKLGMIYVRFWDLYSSEMFLNEHSVGKKYNFTKLDRVLDFLVNNDMIPYIELGVKTKKLIKKYKVLLYQKSEENIFKNKKSLEYFIFMLIKHLINRYGIEEVKKWYFEYWRLEKDNDSALMAEIIDMNEYLECFNIIAREMRKYLPDVKIGGYGISLRYGEESVRESLKLWKKSKQQPSFISLYCYPYPGEKGANGKKPELSMDQNYVKNYMNKAIKMIKEAGIQVEDIHISEWSFTVSNRNNLNDSCIKGAYLTKNILDITDVEGIKLVGYWIGSDLFADFHDSSEFLNGSGGLLTKNGIEKPSYYAFNFMNRLDGNLVKKGENYIISSQETCNYKIVCHNFKNFNYQYCLMDEDNLEIEKFDELLEDNREMKMDFEFEMIKEGRYLVRIHSISKKHGSIQDEWINMGKPEEVLQEDINYLSRVTIPHINVKYIETQNNKLDFSLHLEANEINYIEITYLY